MEKLATQFTLRELCDKTHFTLAEIKDLREKFCTAANGKSALTIDQLGECLSSVFPQSVNGGMLEKLASVLDVDDDGYVSFRSGIVCVATHRVLDTGNISMVIYITN